MGVILKDGLRESLIKLRKRGEAGIEGRGAATAPAPAATPSLAALR